MSAKMLARDGILLALASAFSFLESFVPLPAGMRLGLSSLIVMYAIYTLSTAEAFFLVLLKSCFVLLIRGMTAGLLSVSGGMLSLFGMILLADLNSSVLLTSAIGGMLHNFGQCLAAMCLLRSNALWMYLPLLLLAGMAAGILIACIFRLLVSYLPDTKELLISNSSERMS